MEPVVNNGTSFSFPETDPIEDMQLSELYDQIESENFYTSLYDEQLYNIGVAADEVIKLSSQNREKAVKRSHNGEDITNILDTKRQRNEEEPSTSPVTSVEDVDKVNCSVCRITIRRKNLINHLNSNLHKINYLKSESIIQNFSVIQSAFGSKIITYRINSKTDPASDFSFETPKQFLTSIKDDILNIARNSVIKHTICKVYLALRANFVRQTKYISNTFVFQTDNYIISQGDDLNILFTSFCDAIINKFDTFEKKDSGWSLTGIKFLDMNINKFNPLRGTSYLDLPIDIKNKKAIINVKNSDNSCFKWALLSALYPANNNLNQVSSYKEHSDKLNFNGVPFPVKLTDIAKVEKLNNISINVFGLEFDTETKRHSIVGPLYFTKYRTNRHVNLLFISNGTINHYCFIKNLSRLVSKQISNQEHAIHICDGCLLHFPTSERLGDHQQNDCFHITTELPSSNKTSKNWFDETLSNVKLKFDKFQRKLKLPFVIYADFMAFLNSSASFSNDPCNPFVNHVINNDVYSFGYYIKCSYDESLSKYEAYSGVDCAQVFMHRLYNDLNNITKINNYQKSPEILKTDDNNMKKNYQCHICETDLNGEDVLDFDWNTGKFRGAAHEICVKKFQTLRYIPVILYNLTNYDAHFIIRALNFNESGFDIIPRTTDGYISLSKTLKVNNNLVTLRFIDAFNFLPYNFDLLTNNLNSDQFHTLRRIFPDDKHFKNLIKLNVYPHEFMTSYDCLKLTTLPEQDKFYNSLSDSKVSDDEYKRAQDIWECFKCRNMSDYSNLYLKTNVLLLTDMFENFRNICLSNYGLDPTYYFTAPGLSWDAMLKYTKIELELLTDVDKITFIKAGIRGGITQCSHRYAKANNHYLNDYDKHEPKSYLAYFDANNLYGWAMSQYLPEGGFEWVSPETNFQELDTNEYGYILEVDLHYPTKLHNFHSDLLLCTENISVDNCKRTELISNLCNKIKYKIHYKKLKKCLELGMHLIKTHRILKFKQSPWLKKYIELNTRLRTNAESDIEKDFYKLMINSVFGKTIENVEKRVNVKLSTRWQNQGKSLGAQDLIAKPEFQSLTIFSENSIAIQLRKAKLFYNKPVYLGFCILDISKTFMYDFHYNYMLNKFGEHTKLLYIDTDSLIYQIFTKDFYEDIKPDLAARFDTSNYSSANIFGFPRMNKNKLGYFKDETNGKIIKEFVGMGSRMYALHIEDTFRTKTCVTNNIETDYQSSILNKNMNHCNMHRFSTMKNALLSQQTDKACLSFHDSNILPKIIDSLT